MNFFQKLWFGIKNLFLGFKVIDKKQYDKLVDDLMAKKDKMFEEADANGDDVISCAEVIGAIKKRFKK